MAHRFDAVLFDFSGTLFDASTLLTPARVCAQFARSGVELDTETTADLIEILLATVDSPEGLAARVDCDRSARRHHEVWTTLLASAAAKFVPSISPDVLAESVYVCLTDPRAWPSYPDTPATLHALWTAGLRLGVVSNIGWDIRPAFAGLNIGERIGSFALSCEHGFVKPEPELFHAACSDLKVDPERTLFVGDDPDKDGGAARIGMPVYVLPAARGADRPRGLAAVLRLAAS